MKQVRGVARKSMRKSALIETRGLSLLSISVKIRLAWLARCASKLFRAPPNRNELPRESSMIYYIDPGP